MDSWSPESNQRPHHSVQEVRLLSSRPARQQFIEAGHAGLDKAELRQSNHCRRINSKPGIYAGYIRRGQCSRSVQGEESTPALLRPRFGRDDWDSEPTGHSRESIGIEEEIAEKSQSQ